jgi:MoxR-like ATPase
MTMEDDVQAVAKLHKAYESLKEQVGRVIVGQEEIIEQLCVALFAGGHCLLVGVPGLAKTLLVRTLAQALDLRFSRIQFTPDLMPSDITGTEVIQEDKQTGGRELRFLPGPIFAHVVLADEINRTPPKTQAALLEAMQEHQITVGGKRHRLEEPFFVLATQNPIEQEGTYPLPEAQLDRFLLMCLVGYPAEEEELEIVRRTTADLSAEVHPVLTGPEIVALQRVVRRTPAAEYVMRYAMQLARLTRPREDGSPEFIREYVSWGAGPRASQALVLAAKARAALQGRPCAGIADVQAAAFPVLRHRLVINFNAEAEGLRQDDIIRRLLQTAPAPEEFQGDGGRRTKVFRSPGISTA